MKLTNIKLKLKGGAIMPLRYIKSLNAKNNEEIDFDDLTPEQQMEIRKNLGLYYEETSVGEKEVRYNGEEVSFQDYGYWAKISDDTPAKTDIISCGGETGDSIVENDRADGYDIQPIGAPSGVEFRVVLNDSDGHEPGIYYSTLGAEYASTVSLVYNGEVTTVSKIDAKFLPEQESGSSLSWLDVISLPTIYGDNIDISSNISQQALNDLLDGKYVGIHVLPNMLGIESYCPILSVTKATQGFIYPSIILGNFDFNDNAQSNRVLYLIGSDVTNMSVHYVMLVDSTLQITTYFVAGNNVNIETVYGITQTQFDNLVRGKYNAVKLPADGLDNPGKTYGFMYGEDALHNSSVKLMGADTIITIGRNASMTSYNISISTITTT